MTNRAKLWIALVGFLVVVGGMWGAIVALDLQPRLGLDLEGGVSVTLLPAPGQGEIDDEVFDQTVDVLRDRVDGLGVAEPELARQGDAVLVQLPGLEDQAQAEEVLQETAILQFRRISEVVEPADPDYDEVGPDCDEAFAGVPDADDEVVLCERPEGSDNRALEDPLEPDERRKYVLSPVEVSGGDIDDARARLDKQGLQWQVALDFDSQGEERFQEVTGELACEEPGTTDRQFAIVLDAQVQSAPQVDPSVQCEVGIAGGSAVITTAGQEEAQQLATLLRAGALPIELEIETTQGVSPTLGASALEGGLQAGAIGLLLVAGYLVALYRGIGAIAVVELAMFGAVVYGLLLVLGETIDFTLTLAGVVGVVVSIGIAADSSIIYRERYRDEIRAGRSVRSAADEAFKRAFRTNLTGNTVSFLAALILYLLAIGPVRGFAFTLGLSTLVDTLLFAVFTRSLFKLVANSERLAGARWMGLTRDVVAPTLVGRDRAEAPPTDGADTGEPTMTGEAEAVTASTSATAAATEAASASEATSRRGASRGGSRGGSASRSQSPSRSQEESAARSARERRRQRRLAAQQADAEADPDPDADADAGPDPDPDPDADASQEPRR